MKASNLDHTSVLAALEGQKLRIPDLTKLFQAWPAAQTNTHYQHLTPTVDRIIDDIAVVQPLVSKRKQDDIALATSVWYPQASRGELDILALFTVWLICWDDTVDADEGDLAGDFERAEQWRNKTLRLARRSMKLGDDEKEHVDAINAVLKDFCSHLCGSCSEAQRERVLREMQSFVEACSLEQSLRLEQTIPDYESYMNMRRGTVSGGLLCSLVEYAAQIELPSSVGESQNLRNLWTHVSVLIGLMNDLLSLKKELGAGCVINAVSALLTEDKTLDDVVREIWSKMQQAVVEFDDTAVRLVAFTEADDALQDKVTRYIDGCRAIVTGTLDFT